MLPFQDRPRTASNRASRSERGTQDARVLSNESFVNLVGCVNLPIHISIFPSVTLSDSRSPASFSSPSDSGGFR